MLVGEGEESIQLVETAISRTNLSACSSADEARQSSRRELCSAAIEMISERKPGSLAAPEWLEHAATCIEDDDLESAGISRAELESMLAGPNRASIKKWIEGLATETRVIFVLRAVAGGYIDEFCDQKQLGRRLVALGMRATPPQPYTRERRYQRVLRLRAQIQEQRAQLEQRLRPQPRD